jgi:hypothetical protein
MAIPHGRLPGRRQPVRPSLIPCLPSWRARKERL